MKWRPKGGKPLPFGCNVGLGGIALAAMPAVQCTTVKPFNWNRMQYALDYTNLEVRKVIVFKM